MLLYNVCYQTRNVGSCYFDDDYDAHRYPTGHRRLRKQHHIFPYNLTLSDLCGAIVIAIKETAEVSRQEVGLINRYFKKNNCI